MPDAERQSGPYDEDHHTRDTKSADLLVRMLVDGVSKGGTLLLNLGRRAAASSTPAL